MDAVRARHIARPDVDLHGEEVGDGPTVVLLHAGGERRQVWAPVVERLVEDGLRCVAFDQRGHGDSGGSLRRLDECGGDIAAIVDAEPGCVLVGASLGGLSAVAALGDPRTRAKVTGLVLVDVVPNLDAGRVRRFLDAGGLSNVYPDFIDDVLAHVPRLRQITAQLDIPILLIRAGRGSSLTDVEADGLLQLAPHATVTRIPGTGHLVARDQPEALARTIADLTTPWPALALLRELGAARVAHPGGDLLDHLERVRQLVADLGGGTRVRLAALTHATYGTDGFPHSLLPSDRRSRLRAAIGHDAEALVYRYGACDRAETYPHLGTTPLPLTDRFTGEVVAVDGTDLADFALLTVANELDVVRHAALTTETVHGIRALITACATYVPDAAAGALADRHLT
ncbi:MULTISPECIES: alpha/beta fold hydrolase [Nocardia]|uniref:alpha/beta fold hydrolase n=1 Tax=Nocardia TaxID=1817 RepID=UPI0007EA3875|nr:MULTISPECIES: alpha/beta hydrolase [Nocardia]OBA42832.1 hydrolase [Nocardia sp. 852002-51101_SCH5132738]OBB50473.1 hydrolase [Nocardia sp. 852002-51244_SCH5132740]OBF82373.1 hydrolase [Mycobacterium sp. 852002-51759_SCH5129042]